MRIVHIEDFFHPDAGYQVNILSKYMALDGHEVFVVTSELKKMPKQLTVFFGTNDLKKKDEFFFQETGVKIIRVPLKCYISGRSIYKNDIFRIVEKLEPDILYVHGSDTYIAIRYIIQARKLNYHIVLDNHMLDMASKNKLRKLFYFFYRNICTPIIKKHQIPVIRTVDSDYIQRRFGVPENLSPIVGMGSDTLVFHPDKNARYYVRKELGISNEAFVILYAGKLDESKGGMFLANAIFEKFSVHKEIVFLIIGNTSGVYGDEIESLFSRSQNKIKRLPTQPYKKINRYYQCADMALFPKQCSLSFYDVQACGLPVLFEDNEINIKRTTHGGAFCFKQGNIRDFRDKILRLVRTPKEQFELYANNAVKYIQTKYNYSKLYEKYMIIIKGQVM
ncbi:putative glycosyl transferase [Pelotomaculum schinkii]|uniref:Putative glycosyl transferase n=1 Tax=Pelotomaculum schinkii TaxID=78350 RepID=A0A4Y7RIQ5_9FIRM|nr:glycosyltransferase [Pelotomaculum schinkii]TEB08217.1 putative glycosyl transferase [Pelotomaculum schinkii]